MLGWFRNAVVLVALAGLVEMAAGCDRNIAPFDPDEEPSEPDLGQIFPEGAKRAAEPAQMPPRPGPPGGPAGLPAAPAAAAGPVGDPISGTINLADGLTPPPGSVLFIIARRGAGGPPLAVKRVMSASFPLDFSLGPDDRMIQSMPFEGPLTVTARIDSDGNATSRDPGDLQGALPNPVDTGTTALQLVIDQKL